MDTNLVLLIIFSALGIIDAGYLSYNTLRKTDVLCVLFPKEWCEKVQHSKQSKTFKIPNSYLGLIMYLLIFLFTLGYINGLAVSFWWIQLLVGFGFIFSVYFLFVQAFILRAFCTWCVVSAINFTVMAIAIFLL